MEGSRGYLYKKTKDGLWKKRFCEISGSFLTVYRHAERVDSIIAMVDLSQVGEIYLTEHNSHSQGKRSSGSYLVNLDITQTEKSFVLRALTFHEAESWVKHLIYTRDKAKKSSKSRTNSFTMHRSDSRNEHSQNAIKDPRLVDLTHESLSQLNSSKKFHMIDDDSSIDTSMSRDLYDLRSVVDEEFRDEPEQFNEPKIEINPNIPKESESKVPAVQNSQLISISTFTMFISTVTIGSGVLYFYLIREKFAFQDILKKIRDFDFAKTISNLSNQIQSTLRL